VGSTQASVNTGRRFQVKRQDVSQADLYALITEHRQYLERTASQRLGIGEIAGLSLPNRLAILSACETALGEQVQLAVLKNPLIAHPYHWAPFILVGAR